MSKKLESYAPESPIDAQQYQPHDLDAVIAHLQQNDPILTQSSNVRAFEEEWSAWLGVKHSVFVNSGSSANQLTMAALRLQLSGGWRRNCPAFDLVFRYRLSSASGIQPSIC